jgi:hypothetical protein
MFRAMGESMFGAGLLQAQRVMMNNIEYRTPIKELE